LETTVGNHGEIDAPGEFKISIWNEPGDKNEE
jgi:hypothetical protein